MPIAATIAVRVHSLLLAQDCAQLGARVRTIQYLTGLPAFELMRLLFNDSHPAPRGRAPDTREWYHRANLLHRAEASVVVGNFARLRHAGFGPADALVAAYQDYKALYGQRCRISFDRAFDLAAHTAALWLTTKPSFHLVPCANCGCEGIDAPGLHRVRHSRCPFCDLASRLDRDPRLAATLRPEPIVCTDDWMRAFNSATDAPSAETPPRHAEDHSPAADAVTTQAVPARSDCMPSAPGREQDGEIRHRPLHDLLHTVWSVRIEQQ